MEPTNQQLADIKAAVLKVREELYNIYCTTEDNRTKLILRNIDRIPAYRFAAAEDGNAYTVVQNG